MNIADQPKVIPLWPDGAPGSEDWTQQEQETVLPPPDSFKVVHNVTEPTLTAFLPNPSVASGIAIIVCPGGAFHMLSIDHEGMEVAHWLSARGVAAFVLKYRLVPTAMRDEDFVKQIQSLPEPNKLKEVTRQIEPLNDKRSQLATRISTSRNQQTRPEAASLVVDGWAAHSWGQVLMFQGQTCSTFRVIYH